MKNIIIFSFFIFLVSCSTDDEYVVNFPESVFIEFNWCSYASNKSPDELGAIFIDYRNFLESNSFNASYLNPLFKTDTYDFIMMEFFKNKESFHQNLKDKNGFFYKRWIAQFSQTAFCKNNQKQYFYEMTSLSFQSINEKDTELRFFFCKKLDNVSKEQIINSLNILNLDNEKKVLMLSPENYNDYYDYLFVISTSKDILLEEDFLMKNLGFLVNCELDFRSQDLDELVFENYPLL